MKRRITIVDALASLAPGEGWIIVDEDYDSIQWSRTDMELPTKEELELETVRLTQLEEQKQLQIQAELDAKESAKQSALAKLAKLGLTEEEAKAVIGL